MLRNEMKKYNKVFGNKYRYVTMYAFKKVKHKEIEKGDVYRFLHSYYVIVDKFRYLEIITDSLNLSLNEVSDNLVDGKLRYFYENNQFVVADYIGLLNSPMEIAMIDSIVELDKLKGILAEQETLAAEQNIKVEDIPLLIENRVQELDEYRGKMYLTNVYLGVMENQLIFIDGYNRIYRYSIMGIFNLKEEYFGKQVMSKDDIKVWVLKQKLFGIDFSNLR